MDEASVLLDQARESAVEKVACPICFEGLSEYPDQVGALTLYGNRVESALYHSSCVLNPDTGHLIFESQTGRAVSPLTRQQVDGFKCMPGLSEGQSWAKFLDWNSAGHLDLQKVCAGVAALLPVDDATARRFVVKVLHKSANCGDHAELPLPEVVATLLPAIRRQLRRLLVAPRPRAPEICRNSSKEELLSWFHFWDSQKQGYLDSATLRLAVVTTFHTALAKTADAATKEAVARSFLMELGLRESDSISEAQFFEKMAPQLAANLPAAVGLGHPGNALDVKLPLSLRLREMKTGAERPLYFDCAGQVTVGELREATHRRFPVLLCRRKAKLFVMGQQLEDEQLHLFKVRGIYDGATVNFMPGQRLADCELKSPGHQDLDDTSDAFDSEDDDSDSDSDADAENLEKVQWLRRQQSAPCTACTSTDLSKGSPGATMQDSWPLATYQAEVAMSPAPARQSPTVKSSKGLKTMQEPESWPLSSYPAQGSPETAPIPEDLPLPPCREQAMVPRSRTCMLLVS